MLSITFIFSMRVRGTSLPLTLQLITFPVLRYAEASISEKETLSTTIPEQLMLIKFFFPSRLLFNLPDKTKVSSRFSFRMTGLPSSSNSQSPSSSSFTVLYLYLIFTPDAEIELVATSSLISCFASMTPSAETISVTSLSS